MQFLLKKIYLWLIGLHNFLLMFRSMYSKNFDCSPLCRSEFLLPICRKAVKEMQCSFTGPRWVISAQEGYVQEAPWWEPLLARVQSLISLLIALQEERSLPAPADPAVFSALKLFWYLGFPWPLEVKCWLVGRSKVQADPGVVREVWDWRLGSLEISHPAFWPFVLQPHEVSIPSTQSMYDCLLQKS